MKWQIRAAFLLLLGSALACTITANNGSPIGAVSKMTSDVQAGPAGSLVAIDNTAPLNSGDSVQVSGGHGRARLTLVHGTVVLELYDATNSTTSSTGVSGSQAVMAYLSQGGLTASVKEGSTCTVQVPNGGTFNILGTDAFIVFDPNTGYTTAGNFDGTVNYDSAGGSGQSLPAGTMLDIGPDGSSSPPYTMPFGLSEFDQVVTRMGSPIDTLSSLRKTYQIPEPGQPPTPTPTETPTPAPQGQALFTYDGDQMIPGLAQKWGVDGSVTSGREVWTFFLQSGLTMDTGEPFNAPLVAKTILAQASPEATKGVEIRATDDLTLLVVFFQGSDRQLLKEIPNILFNVQQ